MVNLIKAVSGNISDHLMGLPPGNETTRVRNKNHVATFLA